MADNVNSYVGYVGNTFYAGPNGESFRIADRFDNRKAMDDSLATSNLAIGDYVIVSYGNPTSQEYANNKAIDLQEYGDTYNASLWQKVYEKPQGQQQYVITFAPIAYFSAAVPDISFQSPRLDDPKDFTPWIQKTGTAEAPIFKFNIPNAWNIAVQGDATRAADQYATIEQTGETTTTKTWTVHFPKAYIFSSSASVDSNKNVNAAPTITIGQVGQDGQTLPITVAFPPAWLASASRTVVNADQNPGVTVDTSDNKTQKFAFTLPKNWTLALAQSDVGNAGTQPSVVETGRDASTGVITWKFTLPKSWQFTSPQYESLPAGSQPTVTQVSSDPATGNITWKFSLPRSTHILTGSGAPVAGTVQNEDYYIDINSGDIYDATHAQPIGCFMPPTPAITNDHPTAYVLEQGEWTERDALVGTVTKNAQGQWVFPFSLPKAPKLAVGTTTLVGPTEGAAAAGSIRDSSTYELTFSIPRGARWFSGTIVPSSIAEAKTGDYYLRIDTGEFYYCSGSTWTRLGTLMGDSIEMADHVDILIYTDHITATKSSAPSSPVTINDADPIFDLSGETRIKAILDLLYPMIKPKTSQLLDVAVVDQITELKDTYFAYYLSNVWQLMQINSGLGNLFFSQVSESNISNSKGYSASALNAALSWGSFSDLEDMPNNNSGD